MRTNKTKAKIAAGDNNKVVLNEYGIMEKALGVVTEAGHDIKATIVEVIRPPAAPLSPADDNLVTKGIKSASREISAKKTLGDKIFGTPPKAA